jgi:hypothetical protein
MTETTHFREGLHAGEFLAGIETEHNYSNDIGILLAGNDLPPGAVLGKIVTGGSVNAVATQGNTGNGAFTGLTVGAGVKRGAYSLRITKAAAGAGDFELIDPEGDVAGLGSVAAAFNAGGIAFTLAAGSADFVKGDAFTLNVSALTEKWTQYTPDANDGSQIAAGILFHAVDATLGDRQVVIVARTQIVNGALLTWIANISDADKATAVQHLDALGIVVR